MGWSDLFASFGGMGGAAGGAAPGAGPVFVGGSGEGWMGQQQQLDAAPAGTMGPLVPEKNLGLPGGGTPDPNKGGLGSWMRQNGPGNLKGPADGGTGGGMQQMLGQVQRFAQAAQQPPVQLPRMPVPQMVGSRGGGGGGGLLSAQPAAAPVSGNPYLTATPYARRALQLQRGLL